MRIFCSYRDGGPALLNTHCMWRALVYLSAARAERHHSFTLTTTDLPTLTVLAATMKIWSRLGSQILLTGQLHISALGLHLLLWGFPKNGSVGLFLALMYAQPRSSHVLTPSGAKLLSLRGGRLWINTSALLEKEEMKNPRVSRRKEILKIRAEINAKKKKNERDHSKNQQS